ncbi:MAG: GTPase Era [Bacteroidota bacterium]
MSTLHKSGFVSIIGKPNTGKSTLLNTLLGQKLSIITPKASTTRHRILGIDNGEDYQIVYSDTPGVIKPKYALHDKMMESVSHSLEDADVLVLVIAMDERFPEEEVLKIADKAHIPTLLVINKVDLATPESIGTRIQELSTKGNFAEIIAISALEKFNVDGLQQLILKHLPEDPPYFDKDQLSDRPERFFIAEIIREKIFTLLQQEIPYGTEVQVLEFKEEGGLIRITADIHVERKSQKGMLIGKQGSMIRKIGTLARKDIETFLENKVHLELHVRVSENWKDSDKHLRGFGY